MDKIQIICDRCNELTRGLKISETKTIGYKIVNNVPGLRQIAKNWETVICDICLTLDTNYTSKYTNKITEDVYLVLAQDYKGSLHSSLIKKGLYSPEEIKERINYVQRADIVAIDIIPLSILDNSDIPKFDIATL